jgi:ABC-2 type transport system permease protein
MRLVAAYLRAEALDLARHPGFVVPTIGFPALFYVFFGRWLAGSDPAAAMASYAAFAVFGVVFFQFGVGIAQERTSPWELYLRALPVAPWQRLAARLAAALVFGTASAGAVVAVALVRDPPGIDAAGWARLTAALAAGAVPFGLLGIALGYALSPKAALPLANLIYFGLAYLGGLWTGGAGLDGVAAAISPALPTRQWGDIVAGAAGAAEWHWPSLGWLALWALGLALAARAAYRRSEARQFR